MITDYGKCKVCNGNLILSEKKEVAGTVYLILECEKCNKKIARHPT